MHENEPGLLRAMRNAMVRAQQSRPSVTAGPQGGPFIASKIEPRRIAAASAPG